MSATTPENSTSTSVPEKRPASLGSALGLGVTMLGAIFIVVRPGSQFTPYAGEAAFAGIVAFMFALFVAMKAFTSPLTVLLQRPLAIVLLAWLALIGFGLAHSPNLGAGVPVASDAGGYVLLLLCGFLLARLEPSLVSLFTRALIGMCAVEAFAAIWQCIIDLPQLRVQIANGKVALPHELQTGLAAARIAGNLGYGSFANPNSLAGFLLIGIFLLLGLLWSRKRADTGEPASSSVAAQIPGWFILALLVGGLGYSGSKGGFFAALAGACFFAAQKVSADRPALRRKLALTTFIGVGAAVALLAIGTAGWLGAKPFGLSMEVRLDYWRSAFGMWKSHPLGGVGLAGFADYYPFFKMPLGEEVKDAHNDYVQFAAELGILGPLFFGALWWLTLKPGREQVEIPPEPDLERAKLLELSLIIGGVLAFVLMDGGFMWFNSADALNVIHGHLDKAAAIGAFHTLALPFIFACVVIALRPRFETLAWSFGARAAVGAVLVHQLVDFDFRSPATMGGIFLIGGMLASLQQTPPESSPVKSKRAAATVLLLALLLFPAMVWIPINSSSPRANASDMESEIQDQTRLAALTPDSVDAQRAQQMRQDIFDERKRARDATPFDAEAWIDLGFAYDLLPDASTSNRKAALECFEKAEQLRPVSPLPKLTLAQFYTRHAFEALQARDAQADDYFQHAEKYYAAAAERYPLHPGIRLWQGDSAMMIGNAASAADAYAQALAVDLGIEDTSVRLSAIFTDPRPGAFARHGNDIAVRKLIDRELADEKSAAKLNPKQKQGLLVRRMVALAWLLHEHEQHHVLEAKDVSRTRDELLGTTEKLVSGTDDPAERAHLALFRALAYRIIDGEKNFTDAAKAAWTEARALQQKSIESGRPGTPERTFQSIQNLYGPK